MTQFPYFPASLGVQLVKMNFFIVNALGVSQSAFGAREWCSRVKFRTCTSYEFIVFGVHENDHWSSRSTNYLFYITLFNAFWSTSRNLTGKISNITAKKIPAKKEELIAISRSYRFDISSYFLHNAAIYRVLCQNVLLHTLTLLHTFANWWWNCSFLYITYCHSDEKGFRIAQIFIRLHLNSIRWSIIADQ